MSNLIVVAIPCDSDPVWKISSEKVPHLTLLYLGETEDSAERQRMIEFIQHACDSSLKKFYLSTDYRGTLGDDEADVLYFTKSSAKMVGDFRSNLLVNQELAKAYFSVDQFPEWTPHLTLGYPSKPAKPDPRGRPDFLYGVEFDRIAFWDENYAGPTVQLKREEWEEMSMSELKGDSLVHFGIKGMRWGVRRTKTQLDADSDDSAQAKVTASRIQKNRGSINSISNKDVDQLLNRMNLEQRYSKAIADKRAAARGKSKARVLLTKYKTIKEIDKATGGFVSKAIAKQLAKTLAKAAARSATGGLVGR